jgi:tRNA-Thr(GGU) m(6)t(6)A37 methyltransferase TsaA
MEIVFQSIGFIYSPFKELVGMPIQPTGAKGIRGKVEVFPEYMEGLTDLGGFSHIILLYYFHKTKKTKLLVTPFLDTFPRGIFATRAPSRPNPIGLSIVKLQYVEDNILYIENVDVLDGTPLLDIKPYVPEFDQYSNTQIGWLEQNKGELSTTRADNRFK